MYCTHKCPVFNANAELLSVGRFGSISRRRRRRRPSAQRRRWNHLRVDVEPAIDKKNTGSFCVCTKIGFILLDILHMSAGFVCDPNKKYNKRETASITPQHT